MDRAPTASFRLLRTLPPPRCRQSASWYWARTFPQTEALCNHLTASSVFGGSAA